MVVAARSMGEGAEAMDGARPGPPAQRQPAGRGGRAQPITSVSLVLTNVRASEEEQHVHNLVQQHNLNMLALVANIELNKERFNFGR